MINIDQIACILTVYMPKIHKVAVFSQSEITFRGFAKWREIEDERFDLDDT